MANARKEKDTTKTIEFTDREEAGPKKYDNVWRRNPDKWKREHPYVLPVMKLYAEHNFRPTNVLDIGAGFGHPGLRFIKMFRPGSYTAYEFSSAADSIVGVLEELQGLCSVTVHRQDFRDMSDLDRFDCIIALEILEHIHDDLEFLERIYGGTRILIAVPQSNSKLHMRSFPSVESMINRYGGLLDVRSHCMVDGKWTCAIAVRKG